jgi:ribosomal protein S18 acetylase RimI-like enzyme
MGGRDVVDVNIRPAAASDADAIAGLWQALVDFHHTLDEDLPGAAFNGAQRYARRLVQHLDDPFTRALVAEREGRVIGYVLGMVIDLVPDVFDQEPAGFLADIYVHPDFRRVGIGRALVTAWLDWLRGQRVRYFDWHVAAKNQEALAFWRTMGGRDVMIRMRADLSPKDDEP